VNTSIASNVAGVLRSSDRRGLASQALRRAWRSLTWRHWLIAVGVGVLIGATDAAFRFLYLIQGMSREYPVLTATHVFLVMLTNWIVIRTALACVLLFALALLRDVSRRASMRPRLVAMTIFAVAAFGSLIVAPVAVTAAIAVHASLHLPGNMSPLKDGADWLTGLSRLYAGSGEKIFTFVATVTLSAVYYFKDLRTSDTLAITQLGLSKAQKRRLTEELRGAQASLDPEFLFATLAEVDRRFDGDPVVAQRLLDALIRYLRGALPAKGDAIGTIGQQATLARAWLEIESIRSGGRVQGVINVPGDLDTRLFAPALILPLLAVVCGDTARSEAEAEILVKASLAVGRLTVEVRGHGCEPRPTAETETTLASLRQRLGALYGSSAELSFATGASGGSTAKIVIDDPGSL